ncbi:MAG: thioredoxin-disulfide reductase, partial [Bacillota bacterium]
IYGSRAGIDPLVFMGPEPGGQITISPDIENYPGFPDGINGFELMQRMIKQVENLNGRMIYEAVISFKWDEKPYIIETDSGTYLADTIIINTGASPRKLGLPNENKLVGRGVSYCATCDGAFFKEKEVAVIGGGDTALEEAHYLTKFCSKIYLVHRRDEFRGTRILSERVMNNPKIEILWDSELKEIVGTDKVESLIIENNQTGEKRELTEVSGVFVAIGYSPNTNLFKDYIRLDDWGYIITNDKYMTNIDGIFAAGDVQDPYYRQVITSAGAGAAAAIEASRYIDTLDD